MLIVINPLRPITEFSIGLHNVQRKSAKMHSNRMHAPHLGSPRSQTLRTVYVLCTFFAANGARAKKDRHNRLNADLRVNGAALLTSAGAFAIARTKCANMRSVACVHFALGDNAPIKHRFVKLFCPMLKVNAHIVWNPLIFLIIYITFLYNFKLLYGKFWFFQNFF